MFHFHVFFWQGMPKISGIIRKLVVSPKPCVYIYIMYVIVCKYIYISLLICSTVAPILWDASPSTIIDLWVALILCSRSCSACCPSAANLARRVRESVGIPMAESCENDPMTMGKNIAKKNAKTSMYQMCENHLNQSKSYFMALKI